MNASFVIGGKRILMESCFVFELMENSVSSGTNSGECVDLCALFIRLEYLRFVYVNQNRIAS